MRILAATLAVAAIGSAYANKAEAKRNPPPLPAVVQTATALPSRDTASSMPTGYHFKILGQPIFHPMYGRPAETNPSYDDVRVGLVRASDGQIVRRININIVDFDMSPDGMGDMNARANLNGRYAGVYHLKLYPNMAGNWAIHLSAQVPGEVAPVRGTVTVALVK